MHTEPKATSHLPTRFGDFRLQVFTDAEGTEHLALSAGMPTDGCLVRLHSECATGDILGSLRCDCRDQLELALEKISEAGEGLFIYLRQHEGRGIGLANKIKAYALQDQGMDTVEANITLGFAPDQRNYSAAAAILQHFGLKQIQLLTNNRRKIEALEQAGITITQHIPLWTATNPHNADYVDTKQKRMGHIPPLD
ncbi:MAG: GTP cyclohydrolase II [Alphaproteobacteria bacterium]|nr:GTP cyclohydrolase II [Alphaproteobacteria bacterium]